MSEHGKNALSAENICFSIEGNEILKNITLSATEGRFYGIVGPNGSGKTTLIDILCGYRKNNSGEKYLFGRNLDDYGKKEIARKIALVPQNFDMPFSFRVGEVIEMGRHPFAKRFSSLDENDYRIIENVVDDLELQDFLDREFMTLSGGERQRVIFARALAQHTPILFLDESTSNLDPFFTHSLLAVVKKCVEQRGVTVISVFHELNLASLYCDEIIMMKNGEIKSMGKTIDILNEENISSVFGVDSEVIIDEYTDKPFVITRGVIGNDSAGEFRGRLYNKISGGKK